jgi:hypothetical protein
MAKIIGKQRQEMLHMITRLYEDGYSREDIVYKINIMYNVDYKVSSFKYLLRECRNEQYQTVQILKDNKYMQHCREEYAGARNEDDWLETIQYKGDSK